MHPAVRLVLLLVFAAALPVLSLALNGVLGASLLLAHAATGRLPGLRRVGLAAWRLRWLLAALAILYVGFTPGQPVLEALPGLSREGVIEGSRRVLVLLNLVVAVQLLMALTPLDGLLGGLLWLARPLRVLGLDAERLALRIGLVLEELPRLQQAPRPANALDAVAALAADIETRARHGAAAVAAPALPAAPLAWQWLYPAAAAAAAVLLYLPL